MNTNRYEQEVSLTPKIHMSLAVRLCLDLMNCKGKYLYLASLHIQKHMILFRSPKQIQYSCHHFLKQHSVHMHHER